jgi:hypothetical protein
MSKVLCAEAGLYMIHGSEKSGKTSFLKSIIYHLQQTANLGSSIYYLTKQIGDDVNHYAKCFGALDFYNSPLYSQKNRQANDIITIIDDQPNYCPKLFSMIHQAKDHNYRIFVVIDTLSAHSQFRKCATQVFNMEMISLSDSYTPLESNSIPLIQNTLSHLIPELIALVISYLCFSSACVECRKRL